MTAARKVARAKARPKGREKSTRAVVAGKVTKKRVTASGAKKTARRKPARAVAPAPRKAAKKVAKKAVKKVAKKAAKKPVRKVARTVAKPAGRRVTKPNAKAPARTVASRGGARPAKPVSAKVLPFAPTAFAAQRAGAATRDLMLFELVRARAAVKAALQGLASGRALQPIAPGKWSLLEIVLHLSERDRVRLEEFERLHAGVAPSWRGMTTEQIAAMNDAHLAPLRDLSWDDALRRMDSLRDELMERLARVPADEDVWRKGHAFADTMGHLAHHDRHHAQQIKLARLGG